MPAFLRPAFATLRAAALPAFAAPEPAVMVPPPLAAAGAGVLAATSPM